VKIVRQVFAWPAIAAAVVVALAFTVGALRLTPPAFDVAKSCVAIVAAVLAAKVLAWVAAKGASFGREERLLAFVMLAACGLGWIGTGEWLDERAFDYRVAQQKAELSRALHDTAVRLAEFVDERDRQAPPHPRPATWQHDVDTFGRFEEETVTMYERRFGGRVRAVHDLSSLRGLRDRDLDAFFRHPANEFQMRVIAKKLDGFASALGRKP
jgi:hypothetical protein